MPDHLTGCVQSTHAHALFRYRLSVTVRRHHKPVDHVGDARRVPGDVFSLPQGGPGAYSAIEEDGPVLAGNLYVRTEADPFVS